MAKDTLKIGGINFELATVKKMKKGDLKIWEKFLDVPLHVAETQLERFLEANKK
jgi:hypothetical protein